MKRILFPDVEHQITSYLHKKLSDVQVGNKYPDTVLYVPYLVVRSDGGETVDGFIEDNRIGLTLYGVTSDTSGHDTMMLARQIQAILEQAITDETTLICDAEISAPTRIQHYPPQIYMNGVISVVHEETKQ